MKCKDGREEEEHGHEEAKPRKEVPIGACHPLDLKLSGFEGPNGRVHAPARIDAAEAELVAETKEDQEHRGDSIEKGGTHFGSCLGFRRSLTARA